MNKKERATFLPLGLNSHVIFQTLRDDFPSGTLTGKYEPGIIFQRQTIITLYFLGYYLLELALK